MGDQHVVQTGLATRGIGKTIPSVLVLTLLGGCLYALSWNGEAAGFLSDDAVYLMMADALSPFRHADPGLSAYVMRQAIFPPFYPFLLAMLGAGSTSLLWAHVVTTTTLILALAVYGVWIHSEIQERAAGLALVAIFALLPGVLIQNLEILSESPYLLFSLAALQICGRNPTPRASGFAALCVGIATVTRSAGLSLLVAFGIWLFRHRVEGRLKWLLVAIVPSLSWLACKRWVFQSKGGYDSLWGWLLDQFQHNEISDFVPSFLVSQLMGMWHGLSSDLDLRPSRLTDVVLAITLIAALPVWVQRLRTWRLDAWYLLVGGAMILLYPFPTFFNRLLLPWIPIILLYAWLGMRAATRNRSVFGGKPMLGYAYLAILLLALLPSLGFVAHRIAEPVNADLAIWKHTRYWYRYEPVDQIKADIAFRQNLIVAARETGRLVPEGDCVFAVHTAITMLYAKRIVEQPPGPNVSASEFDRRAEACRYFLLLQTGGSIGAEHVAAFYPNARLRDGRTEFVHEWSDAHDVDTPTAILLRVKPSG